MHMIIKASAEGLDRTYKVLVIHNMNDPRVIFLDYFDLPPDSAAGVRRSFETRFKEFARAIKINGQELESLRNNHFLPEWWSSYSAADPTLRVIPLSRVQFEVLYDKHVPEEEQSLNDDVSSGQ